MALIEVRPRFGRVLVAMVTPLDADGKVDLDQAAKLADHLINNGVDGLVIAGTTGESATLKPHEKIELFKRIKETVGSRASVLAGTSSYDTEESVSLSREAARTGIDGLLCVTPYYNKPSQEGLYQHFKAIAGAVDVPVMLYSVQGRTGVNLEPNTVGRLAQVENIVAIKEASKNIEQVAEIARDTPDDFLIYSGDDGMTLPMLAVGGCGVVSVTGHIIGREIGEMIEAFHTGDHACAARLHARSLAMTKILFSFPSPAPTKVALETLGLLKNSVVRLPHVPPTSQEREAVQDALRRYGRFDGLS